MADDTEDEIPTYSYFFLRVLFLFRKVDVIESNFYTLPKDSEDYSATDVILVFSMIVSVPISMWLKYLKVPFAVAIVVFVVCYAAHYYYWNHTKTTVAVQSRFQKFKPDPSKDFLLLLYIAFLSGLTYMLWL